MPGTSNTVVPKSKWCGRGLEPNVVVAVWVFALLLAACPSGAAPKSASKGVPKRAICAVCGPREGAGPERVAATVVYQGRTYYFCKPACLEEFNQDPEHWIRLSQEAAPGQERPKPSGGSTAPL